MNVIALIPARLGASRFPGKMLALIAGKPVICRTYESAVATGLFKEVIVVTDSREILDTVTAAGGRAVMSQGQYESGTDRIAEIAAGMEADVFVNVQGDEPFVQREPLARLLEVFEGAAGRDVQVASLVQHLTDPALVADPNYVKVALDLQGNALMFSRSVIPYPRNEQQKATYLEHIGVYAFRKQALMQFTAWPMTPLETAEKIECLRFLEHGVPMRMVVARYMGVEIDVPEDIARAEAFLQMLEGGATTFN